MTTTTTTNTTTTTRPDIGGPDDICFDVENTEQDHLITPNLRGDVIPSLLTIPIGEFGGVPLYLDRYGLRPTPPDDAAALPHLRAVMAARIWFRRYAPAAATIDTDTTSRALAGAVLRMMRHCYGSAADGIEINSGDVILAAILEEYYLIPDLSGGAGPWDAFFAAEIAKPQSHNP